MKRKPGFTLVEIIVVVFIVAIVSGIAYRLMSGTFSQYFKSQSKLTNLRAASIILERIKADIRLALIPIDDSENPVIEAEKLSFCITDEGKRRMVTYTFNSSEGKVIREVAGGSNRVISLVRVGDFKVAEVGEEDRKLLSIAVVVDNEKDQEIRTETSLANQVELKAVLYPRFFTETLSDEEKFWNLARTGAGGST